VIEIIHIEQPKGVIVQYGGQTPLNLARQLEAAGVPVIGTSPESIDRAEDREHFQRLLKDLGLRQPPNRTAMSADGALELGDEIGYPLVVRPPMSWAGGQWRSSTIVKTLMSICMKR
jgi:carbamoyl-phosphate synthase large subunit